MRSGGESAGTVKMKLLVTGGAGFIGSAVCRDFVLRRGWSVLNVDKLTYAAVPGALDAVEGHARYRFMRADVCDRLRMGELLAEWHPDAILHLAAESHVDRSISGPEAFVRTNVLGTWSILDAAREYWERLPAERRDFFRVLLVSTDEVYGSLGETGRFTERSPYDPSSPYSASKAGADHLGMAWHRTYGLPVIISNCSNNYGPWQFPEKLIPLMSICAFLGRPMPVYGDGRNVRDWLHVEDHVHALRLILQGGRPGGRYVVGGHGERTNMEVVEAICAIADRLRPGGRPHRRLVTHVADRPGHDLRYAMNPARIERELGWRPHVSFAEGLEETVRWYFGNESWWRPLLERMPSDTAASGRRTA